MFFFWSHTKMLDGLKANGFLCVFGRVGAKAVYDTKSSGMNLEVGTKTLVEVFFSFFSYFRQC